MDMGHYACDMRPEWFDGYQAPKEPPSTDLYFVVDNDFSVCTVLEYAERHRWVKMKWGSHDNTEVARVQLAFMAKHQARADAEIQARVDCEAAVDRARQQTLRLKKICKVERPWEKK